LETRKLETVWHPGGWDFRSARVQAKMATIIEVKNLFKEELAPIHSKLEIMMYTFQDLNKTVKSFSAKYDDLLLQFRSLNDKTQSCNQDIASIKKDLNGLNTCAVNASMQAEELAQYLRRDCLEISGTKATSTCSAEAIVKSVGKAIGVAVSQNDISITHPIPSYNRNAPPKIIVKFTPREVRNKFYSNRWNLAKKKVKDFPDL
jgi:6-pyruvoyl-tetrahydropterin synthase